MREADDQRRDEDDEADIRPPLVALGCGGAMLVLVLAALGLLAYLSYGMNWPFG